MTSHKGTIIHAITSVWLHWQKIWQPNAASILLYLLSGITMLQLGDGYVADVNIYTWCLHRHLSGCMISINL